LPKNSAKKLAFLTENKAKLCKILTITLVFEKNAIFFAGNRQKSQKIVIITSTPGIDSMFQESEVNAVITIFYFLLIFPSFWQNKKKLFS
jgi:hypothetical protein